MSIVGFAYRTPCTTSIATQLIQINTIQLNYHVKKINILQPLVIMYKTCKTRPKKEINSYTSRCSLQIINYEFTNNINISNKNVGTACTLNNILYFYILHLLKIKLFIDISIKTEIKTVLKYLYRSRWNFDCNIGRWFNEYTYIHFTSFNYKKLI